MLDDNKTNSIKKAQKHINLNLKVKQIFNKKYPEYLVYLATHTKNPIYQDLEEKSNEEFWSIKLRTPKNHRQLKNPDIIIANNYRALFLIEVKWGVLEGCYDTDLRIDMATQKKMIKIRQIGGECSIRGPATRNGKRYRNVEFSIKKKVIVDEDTQFIFISDFMKAKKIFKLNQYKEIINNLNEQLQDSYIIADIYDRVDDIPYLKKII